MSTTELEESARSLPDTEQKRLIALLVAEQTRREGERFSEKAQRLEEAGNWVSWDEVKKDLDITDAELDS